MLLVVLVVFRRQRNGLLTPRAVVECGHREWLQFPALKRGVRGAIKPWWKRPQTLLYGAKLT